MPKGKFTRSLTDKDVGSGSYNFGRIKSGVRVYFLVKSTLTPCFCALKNAGHRAEARRIAGFYLAASMQRLPDISGHGVSLAGLGMRREDKNL